MKLTAITGAANGIGAALAKEAVNRGHRVILFDRDQAALTSVRSDLGETNCEICVGDVTNDVDLARFRDLIEAQTIPLRFAFANAGILRAGEVLSSEIDELEQLFAINVLGAVRTARALVPLMRRQPERSEFVFTGSTSMLSVAPSFGGYAASKHALLALAEALDAELMRADASVRVAVLCPAAVQTDIASGASPELTKLQRRMETHGITPDQMAQIAFDELASGQRVIFSSNSVKSVAENRLRALLSGQLSH